MTDQKLIISGYRWVIKECTVHTITNIKFCPFCGTKLPSYRKRRPKITEEQKELF